MVEVHVALVIAATKMAPIDSQDPVSGLLSFTFVSTGATTTLPISDTIKSGLVFPHLTNDGEWSTGFAVNNVGGNWIALSVTATSPSGQVLGELTHELAPHQRWVAMSKDVFPSLPASALLHVAADGEIAGFALGFRQGNAMMFAVPALPVE